MTSVGGALSRENNRENAFLSTVSTGGNRSRTHVFLRCMHPKLEGARKDFWDRPDEDGKI
jgi:hypothetical protein